MSPREREERREKKVEREEREAESVGCVDSSASNRREAESVAWREKERGKKRKKLI
jgi:hypothetical protein